MVSTVWSAVLQGVSATLVRIEASASPGLPQVRIVGMPATDVKESLDRVRQALRSIGVLLPAKRIVVNLFPASLRKTGSQLDLAIAAALLQLMGHAIVSDERPVFCLGELGLDGSVHSVNGMLPLVSAGQLKQELHIIVPKTATEQLYMQPETPLFLLHHLRELRQKKPLKMWDGWHAASQDAVCGACVAQSDPFTQVRGQSLAQRALSVAIAGGHHTLLIGPPGCGKSFLAQQAAQLLPRIPLRAAQELLTIQSICGDPMRVCDLCGSVQAPLRAPHHSVTAPVLVGGGTKVRPGEISRAHHGVLLLDEIGEMKRTTVEQLRQPLQDGRIAIARQLDRVVLPARFQLIATMNPCPCGYFGSTAKPCECSRASRAKYHSLVRGPLGDRFDSVIRMEPVAMDEYVRSDRASSSDRLQKIATAVQVQRARRIKNAWLSERHRSSVLSISVDDARWLGSAVSKRQFTARGALSVLKLARTVADMEGAESILRVHLAEAMQLRRTVS